MCWSLEGSIITWIISLSTAIYLLVRKRKNDIVMGLLILTYSSMQLWETLMWYDQKCGAINMIGTKMAYIALWSHIIAIAIGLYIEYGAVAPMFLGIAMFILAYIMRPTVWKCSKPGANHHLVWGFDPTFYMIVFTIAIILCLYYIKPVRTAVTIASLFILTLLLTCLYNWEYDTTGTFWCWICAVFSFVFIFTQ